MINIPSSWDMIEEEEEEKWRKGGEGNSLSLFLPDKSFLFRSSLALLFNSFKILRSKKKSKGDLMMKNEELKGKKRENESWIKQIGLFR